jgi:hypothetical protein
LVVPGDSLCFVNVGGEYLAAADTEWKPPSPFRSRI